MNRVIKVEGADVYIALEDQRTLKVPVGIVNYQDPQPGDEVRLLRQGNSIIVARAAEPAQQTQPAYDVQPQNQYGGQNQYADQSYSTQQPYSVQNQSKAQEAYNNPQADNVQQSYNAPNQYTQQTYGTQSQNGMQQQYSMPVQDSMQNRYSEQPQYYSQPAYMYNANEKHYNKHVFVWIGAFLFGGIGVDRFMRGQIGLGILKIITLSAFGVWSLVDFIISLVKAYGGAFGNEEDIVFINGKYAR